MIVNYSGHGANTYWDAPRVTIANIEALTNQGMYPFIVSNACITGTFDTYAECFMEAWIRKSGKGAIGSLGASNSSYWDEDDVFERRMYDSVFVPTGCSQAA
jgi:hypothetical protein